MLKFEYRICTSFNWTSKFAEEMIHEQLDLIDKEELNNYIHAKKYVQTLTEEEVKNLCVEVKN